jgi:outer membrane protein TolC
LALIAVTLGAPARPCFRTSRRGRSRGTNSPPADRSLDAVQTAFMPDAALSAHAVVSSLIQRDLTGVYTIEPILGPLFDAGRLRAEQGAAALPRADRSRSEQIGAERTLLASELMLIQPRADRLVAAVGLY